MTTRNHTHLHLGSKLRRRQLKPDSLVTFHLHHAASHYLHPPRNPNPQYQGDSEGRGVEEPLFDLHIVLQRSRPVNTLCERPQMLYPVLHFLDVLRNCGIRSDNTTHEHITMQRAHSHQYNPTQCPGSPSDE